MARTVYFVIICVCVGGLLVLSDCRKKKTNQQTENRIGKSMNENYMEQMGGADESETIVVSEPRTTTNDSSTVEPDIIGQAGSYDELLRLWKQGNIKSIDKMFLEIDWENPAVFSETSIVKLMSKDMDKEFASLPEAEKENINQKLKDWSKSQGTLSKHIIEIARVSINAKQYDFAEKQLNALLRCGEVLSQANSTLVIELGGYGTQQRALEELIRLYSETGEQAKLSDTQKRALEVKRSRSRLLGR
jgi:hypothetical protein